MTPTTEARLRRGKPFRKPPRPLELATVIVSAGTYGERVQQTIRKLGFSNHLLS